MWTNENRGRYDRGKLRYPSDLTDAEWDLVGPLIPPAKRGGNKRAVDVREVVNGLMCVLGTGCPSGRSAACPSGGSLRDGQRSRRTCLRAAR